MNDQIKKCPYCAEDVLVAAIKCKHCGEFLNDSIIQRRHTSNATGKLRKFLISTVAIIIIAAFLLILILIIFQVVT